MASKAKKQADHFAALNEQRDARRHEIDDDTDDPRSDAQRDRDRILYSSAFRRLSGVTQVVSADEGLIIHNRLTHTLKVAQVGRRIAERILKEEAEKAWDQRTSLFIGGLDADVVEAAALAHDLGHPPFGHIAEEELDRMATKNFRGPVDDGFEGNAQSFRIVTRQSRRSEICPGLNLTRATLNAIVKYPWHRLIADATHKHYKKFGAYTEDETDFKWCREGFPGADEEKSAEAEIMDWSDDIAYALHDVEDFYRAGLIPFDRLVSDPDEQKEFFRGVWERLKITSVASQTLHKQAFFTALGDPKLATTGPFIGEVSQRINLRRYISGRIGHYAGCISLRRPTATNKRLVHIHEAKQREMDMLKQITWHYVITNPALATQQHGQRLVIRRLFSIFRSAAAKGDALFPIAFRDRLRETKEKQPGDEQAITRVVVDLIASMTEQQALKIFQKLTGISPGSALDRHLHQTIG